MCIHVRIYARRPIVVNRTTNCGEFRFSVFDKMFKDPPGRLLGASIIVCSLYETISVKKVKIKSERLFHEH